MDRNTTPNWMIANYYENELVEAGRAAEGTAALAETAKMAVRRAIERYSLTCPDREHRAAAAAYLAASSYENARELYETYPPMRGTTEMTSKAVMALEGGRPLDALICCASATANEGPVVSEQDMVDAEHKRNLRVLTFLSTGNPV
ncbi:MAG: hypothetical protein KKC03_13195 [Bacteroidetes bacterium]|nr:hypothetical protein [Bacteroidota bacterium]